MSGTTLLSREDPEAHAEDLPEVPARRARRVVPTSLQLGLILAVALSVRLINLNRFGYNGDEAVYAGEAASLAGNRNFTHMFPIFRAHPLLFPTLVSPLYGSGVPDWTGRVVVALFGVATVAVVFLLGRELYSDRVGILAALLMALMPYHTEITRQVLLDGPAVFFITLAMWMIARYLRTKRASWLLAGFGTLGLAALTKETSLVMAGSLVVLLLLSAEVRRPVRSILVGLVVLGAVTIVMPLASSLAPHKSSNTSYLAWQLTRRSNHAATFYLTVVPAAIGWAVVALAALAIILNRRERTWRELLLISWALVPLAVFELYPLKGYQYLLPLAPAIAILAARGLSILPGPRWFDSRAWDEFRTIIGAVVVLSLLPGLWNVMFPGGFHASLAGSGGLPGGRDAGQWVATHVAQGSELMTIGPSMANVLEYYGHRPALGLSVSTNPLHRNPAYTPIPNPDQAIRSGQFAFLVWDAYSAHRSPYSAIRLGRLLERYHAQPVLTETVGGSNRKPVIIIYEVHP